MIKDKLEEQRKKIDVITLNISNVVCAIDSSVNTLRIQLIFNSNPIFTICLNFQQQNPFINQYLPHLSSKNLEIKFIKYDLLKTFQQHEEHPQISIQFFVSILFSFH